MSRAFTKEDDAGDDLIERPVPPGPNYVTPRGLELLKRAGEELAARRGKAPPEERKAIDRDLRYLEIRIGSATVVPRGSGPEARFGAKVALEDESGNRKIFRIVGEDEARADPEHLLAWSAPLVQAVLGTKAGDRFSWGPAEARVSYTVASVEYPA